MAEEKKKKEEKTEEVSGNLEDLIKSIENLSVLELSELVKALEERLGVSAAAPVAAAAPAAADGGQEGGGEEEEKSKYTMELKSVGDKKIEVIKIVRDITGQGLKEAKDLVDSAVSEPQVIKEDVPAEEAKEAEGRFSEIGAQVELK